MRVNVKLESQLVVRTVVTLEEDERKKLMGILKSFIDWNDIDLSFAEDLLSRLEEKNV